MVIGCERSLCNDNDNKWFNDFNDNKWLQWFSPQWKLLAQLVRVRTLLIVHQKPKFSHRNLNNIYKFSAISIYIKGVVRSKISHGYVSVDSLGATLIFTPSNVDKNWPLKTWASKTTHSKNDFCPTLADLKSQAKLPPSDVREQSTDQICQGVNCRRLIR